MILCGNILLHLNVNVASENGTFVIILNSIQHRNADLLQNGLHLHPPPGGASQDKILWGLRLKHLTALKTEHL